MRKLAAICLHGFTYGFAGFGMSNLKQYTSRALSGFGRTNPQGFQEAMSENCIIRYSPRYKVITNYRCVDVFVAYIFSASEARVI